MATTDRNDYNRYTLNNNMDRSTVRTLIAIAIVLVLAALAYAAYVYTYRYNVDNYNDNFRVFNTEPSTNVPAATTNNYGTDTRTVTPNAGGTNAGTYGYGTQGTTTTTTVPNPVANPTIDPSVGTTDGTGSAVGATQ